MLDLLDLVERFPRMGPKQQAIWVIALLIWVGTPTAHEILVI